MASALTAPAERVTHVADTDRLKGLYLLGSSRALRGKYKDLPLDEIHTQISAEPEIVASALREGFTELAEAAPDLVEPVASYVRFRIETGTKHDKREMCKYLVRSKTGSSDAGHRQH